MDDALDRTDAATLDRGPFLLYLILLTIGVVAFAGTIASLFDRDIRFLRDLFLPSGHPWPSRISPRDHLFWFLMAAVVGPAVWALFAILRQRLRGAKMPAGLAYLLFVPAVNLILIALLCLVPGGEPDLAEPRQIRSVAHWLFPLDWLPESGFGSAIVGTILTVLVGIGGVLLSAVFAHAYGWALFVGLPFCLGSFTTMIYGYHERRSFWSSFCVSGCALFALGSSLLLFGIEGAICLVLATPLALPLVALGCVIGFVVQDDWHEKAHRRVLRQKRSMISGLLIAWPAVLGVEQIGHREPPAFAVQTAIEVDAPPETVWRHVVSFSELPEPDDWLFHVGVAYPMRAKIEGTGVGAVRYCEFSTGPFVEPITAWDPPRKLAFDVIENPEPMKEWTFYPHVHPPHLDGFMVSKRGQFELVALPGGRTRIEGTTWYRHTLWPAEYWQLWSDAIIHKIHGRVLRHIKSLAEEERSGVVFVR